MSNKYTYDDDYDPFARLSDFEEVKRLERKCAKLGEENERLREELSTMTSNWVQAQDLASQRQMLLMLKENK